MDELASTVIVALLACSAAIVLVLTLRKAVRHCGGAQVAYALWGLVPLATLATLMPAPARLVIQQLAPAMSHSVDPISRNVAPMAETLNKNGFDVVPWLVSVWMIGIAISFAAFLWQRRRFLRDLGPLRAIDRNMLRAQTVAGCPALVGMWPPRIVLPVDFEQRYSPLERDLILAHERHHLVRGDTHVNTLAVSLRSLFWFNPLVHYAATYFLIDQEVACDAAVIARFPHARRPYAEAMLKTQLAYSDASLACHWHSRSPLAERIVMLKRPSIGRSRRWIGATLAAILIVSGTYAAWAAQPARIETRYIDGSMIVLNSQADERAMRDSREDGGGIVVANISDNHASPATTAPATSLKSLSILAQRIQYQRADDKSKSHASQVIANRDRVVTQSGTTPAPGGNSSSEDIDSASSLVASDRLPVRIGGDIGPQEIPSDRLAHPAKYPAAAARSHVEGNVVLKVHVDEHGRPVGTDVVSVVPATATELASASATAVLQWRFTPALRAGIPVEGNVLVPFAYALNGDRSFGAPAVMRQASLRTTRAIDYPLEQARAGVEGVVYVKVQVGKDGGVSSASVDRIAPSIAAPLAAAALAGVNAWTFNPARRNGWDVASTAVIPVVFALHANSPTRVAPALDRLDPILVTPKA